MCSLPCALTESFIKAALDGLEALIHRVYSGADASKLLAAALSCGERMRETIQTLPACTAASHFRVVLVTLTSVHLLATHLPADHHTPG